LAAGDQAGYQATCSELIARHGPHATAVDAYNIALTCVIGQHAVEDMERVLTLANRAVASIPFNPIYGTVLGAAQFRAGRTAEAVVTLERARPLYAAVSLAAPNLVGAVHGNQLLGEVYLGFCYRDLGEREKLQLQIERVRRLIEKLEKFPPEFGQVVIPWALTFAVELGKRELDNLVAPEEALAQ